MLGWKKVALGCGGVAVLAVALGAFVAWRWIASVERTVRSSAEVEIVATPDEIRPFVEDLARWHEWSAWRRDVDADVLREFSKPSSGAGATLRWRPAGEVLIRVVGGGRSTLAAPAAGEGTLRIVTSAPAEIAIETRHTQALVLAGVEGLALNLTSFDRDFVVPGRFQLEASGTKTRVRWSEEIDFGQGFAGGMLASSMGEFARTTHAELLSKSLERLRTAVESR